MSNLTTFLTGGISRFNAVQIFNSSGTFTPPPGVTQAMALVWGGGGDGYQSSNQQSGGGGGGGFAQGIIAVTPGNGVSVTVGAKGGTSSFGAYLSATGGATATGITGGAGGSGSVGVGANAPLWSFTASGGAGGSAYSGVPSVCGGGGSGSPYGTGGKGGSGRQFNNCYSTGGGGWGGDGGGNVLISQIPTLQGHLYASGGGGLKHCSDSYSGGGASKPSQLFSTLTYRIQVPGSLEFYGNFPGGGKEIPAVMGATGVSNALASSQINESENLFDVVNMTLAGFGGDGAYQKTGGAFGGGGGPGAGGGSAYSQNAGSWAGWGGTGGGGGSAWSDSGGIVYGGWGGFGGGGGAANAQANESAIVGGSSIMGGGGGGISYQNAPSILRVGQGGPGCVLVFYKV